MLHQPASTFKPSQPAPSTAQPFDAKRYLQRARELGLMVFPNIMPSGRPTFGLSAFPGYSWSRGNERLANEFSDAMHAASDTTAAVFEALCDDFGIDPADADFNGRVSAVCRERSRDSTDGDKRLIELCKQARAVLEKDLAVNNRLSELEDQFETIRPQQPTYITALGAEIRERDDAKTMRGVLADGLTEWSRSATKAYRARIANVVAYEKERDRVRREIGLSQAEAASKRICHRAAAIVGDVAELPATTLLGLAHKGAILPLWKAAGYGLDYEGERLAFSIADDARMLGTGGPLGGRSAKPTPALHENRLAA